MNTYEQLLYLLRIPVLIISAVIIALIFQFTQPELAQAIGMGEEAPEGIGPVRADLYAGLIASNQQLHERPGVFSPRTFNQDTADDLLVGPQREPHLYAVNATLRGYDGEVILGPIIINKPAHTQLQPRIGTRGVEQHTKQLPAAVKHPQGTKNALLEVVVTYES